MKNGKIPYLVAFSILVFSCASPQKSYQRALKNAPYDVIIVPGIPYQDQNWASNIMRVRVAWSCFLYSRGITRHIIYSGNAVYTPYVEGKIMAMHARALGVPDSAILCETLAEHSTENIAYSYRMAKKAGFKKIAVATDAGQSGALTTFAWDYRIPVTFIPVVSDSLDLFRFDTMLKIDPSPAFVKDFIPLPQRESIIKRFMGTLGLEIREAVPE